MKEVEYVEPSPEELEEFEAKQRTANREREAAEALAMILVGAPLYYYHWKVISRDRQQATWDTLLNNERLTNLFL